MSYSEKIKRLKELKEQLEILYEKRSIVSTRMKNCQDYIRQEILDNVIKTIKHEEYKVKRCYGSIYSCDNEIDCDHITKGNDCDNCGDCRRDEIIELEVLWDLTINTLESSFNKTYHFDYLRFEMDVVRKLIDYIDEHYNDIHSRLQKSNDKFLKIEKVLGEKIVELQSEQQQLEKENKEYINNLYCSIGNVFTYVNKVYTIEEVDDEYIYSKTNNDNLYDHGFGENPCKVYIEHFISRIKSKQVKFDKRTLRFVKIGKII